MPRPINRRMVGFFPRCRYYKPAGIPLRMLEEVVLSMDELEAIRLCDAEGLYQDAAAERMGISRQTLGRIIENARKKVANALVTGKAIRMEGGNVTLCAPGEGRPFECHDCGNTWCVPVDATRPAACPRCRSPRIRRSRDGGTFESGR